MTTNSVTLDFNDGQIANSGLPNDRRENFLPSVVGFDYCWLRIGGHLGNVCLLVVGILLQAREAFGDVNLPSGWKTGIPNG